MSAISVIESKKKKRNVLIVSLDYIAVPTSNGVIGLNLACSLLNRGDSVWMVTNWNRGQVAVEQREGFEIHRVKYDYYGQFIKNKNLQSLFFNFIGLLHIFAYPLSSFWSLHVQKKKIKKLIKEHDISLLIALHNPFLGGPCAVSAKKIFGDKIKTVLYDLDSYTNKMSGRFLSQKQKFTLMQRWERKVFNSVDAIIVMNNHEKHYEQSRFDIYRHKMGMASFPMLSVLPEQEKKKHADSIHCYFAGTLDLGYRNPKPVLEVVTLLEETFLHVYGRIENTEELIKRYRQQSNNRIVYEGMLPFLQLQEELHEADFLISIGNSSSDMVPAKTYEYISYLKPIIHFYSFDEDPVLPELKKYPLALLADSRKEPEQLALEIQTFMNDTMGKRVEKAYVLEHFALNTPEYSLDLIDALLYQ